MNNIKWRQLYVYIKHSNNHSRRDHESKRDQGGVKKKKRESGKIAKIKIHDKGEIRFVQFGKPLYLVHIWF